MLHICTATAIVDLCRDRDNHNYDVFTHSDFIDIIQMLLHLLVCILHVHFIIVAFVLSSYVQTDVINIVYFEYK